MRRSAFSSRGAIAATRGRDPFAPRAARAERASYIASSCMPTSLLRCLITSISRFLVSEPLSARHEGPGIGSVSGFSISGCPGESEEGDKVIMSVYRCVVHESQTFRIWKRTQSRCIMASYTSAKPSVFGNNLNHFELWRCTYQPNLPYLEMV